MSIAQTWFGRTTARLRGNYGLILCPGAGLEVSARRHSASIPIRRSSVATATRPITAPSAHSMSRGILAVVRQKIHLSCCPNFPSHLSSRASAFFC